MNAAGDLFVRAAALAMLRGNFPPIVVINDAQRVVLDRGDFFAHVREELELSRGTRAQILQPVDTLYRAVDLLGNAGRATVAAPLSALNPEICAFRQRAAELAALAVRLGIEGTPVFPATLPNGGRA